MDNAFHHTFNEKSSSADYHMETRILVVDDDKAITWSLTEYLKKVGFQVKSAETAEQALSIMEEDPVELVVTDIMLPGLDGLKLTETIKQNYDTEVIVITGYSNEYSYEDAVDKGATDFVFKPVRFEELNLRIKRVLRERRLKKELHALAITDGLTRLYNSRHFYEMLKREKERADRYGKPLSLMIFDIDNFKDFNEKYLHLGGDKVLSTLGRIIMDSLRRTDSAYRYGGDEFAVILPETDPAEAMQVADRLRKIIENEKFHPVEDTDIQITISNGITDYNPGENISDFIRRADDAMFESKQKGRNQITLRKSPGSDA